MKNLARLLGITSGNSATPAENKKESVTSETEAMKHRNDVQYLKIEHIAPNPFQPRKSFHDETLRDLAASIREFGVIQPLLVRQTKDGYELIAGERRLRASKLAELETVPVIVKALADQEMAELAMIENLQREDLHYLEEAEGFQQLIANFGFTQDELAKRMGKKQSTIANKLRLLKLEPDVRCALREQGLTERHARALLKLPETKIQMEAVAAVRDGDLNVRETESLVQELLERSETPPKPPRQKMVGVIRDVRIFLNTIHNVAGEMKKNGLEVKIAQEQDDDYITVKMTIPKRK